MLLFLASGSLCVLSNGRYEHCLNHGQSSLADTTTSGRCWPKAAITTEDNVKHIMAFMGRMCHMAFDGVEKRSALMIPQKAHE
jgi:hypothetical protein